MRDEKNMLSAFMPLHEKEYEARLFIDEAIKSKAEYTLESLARALSGKYEIKFVYAEKDTPFERSEHIKGDNDTWIVKTTKYGIRIDMKEYSFFGNTKTQLWLKVIQFWAGDIMVFPCGGASFPNKAFTCTYNEPNS